MPWLWRILGEHEVKTDRVIVLGKRAKFCVCPKR
jgi:hypothetical protein